MDEMRPPKSVGRYEVLQPIGRGGFSTVYLGRDPYIHRAVALKITQAGPEARSRPAFSRLFREAEAAGGLVHPNIVTIYDVGIQDGFCYIAMEYIEGTTLHRHTHPAELLPLAEVLDVVAKVCHGLDYAHQRGVIHRDMKPSNVLLGAHGEIKITDFGLACFQEVASADRKTVGTPSYMPPEQAVAKGSTPRSDLFSVGVILYQLLSGAKPFEAANPLEMLQRIAHEPHTPLRVHSPELPPALFAITDRALAKKPEDRFPSAMDMAREIEEVLAGSGPDLGDELARRVSSLRALAFFESFSDREIASLLAIGGWIEHGDGDIIVAEREQADAFYVIAEGEARVCRGERTIRRLVRGDCFGEISFLLGTKRTATIVAAGRCRLLRLNPAKIEILEPHVQAKLYRLFAHTVAGLLLEAQGEKRPPR